MTAATASRARARGRTGSAGSLLDPALAATASLGIPVLLFLAGEAPLERFLYPAANMVLAGWLYARRSAWYPGFCIWLFCATALVRRLADEQSGWDPANPILLSPYLACAFAGLTFCRRVWRNQFDGIGPFLVLAACIAYGLMLAALNGRLFSGVVDAMRWSVGPIFAVYVIANASQRTALYRAVTTSFLVAAVPMAAYGVAQFYNPQRWDVHWMIGAASLGLDSAGQPEAFKLRVFSTMNSAGPFGVVMGVGILVGLQRLRTILAVPAVLSMALGLLLSQYRAIWGGTLVGLIVLLISSSRASRIRIVAAVAAAVLFASFSATIPEVRQAISDRIASLSQLGADASGEDRVHQYDRFVNDPGRNLVLGDGLAVDGSRRLDHQKTVIIDSGLLEAFAAFGAIMAPLYLACLGRLVWLTTQTRMQDDPALPLYRAVAAMTFSQLPFGNGFTGESGFGTWLMLGLALSASPHTRCSRRSISGET